MPDDYMIACALFVISAQMPNDYMIACALFVISAQMPNDYMIACALFVILEFRLDFSFLTDINN
jgi:hypothetical protein